MHKRYGPRKKLERVDVQKETLSLYEGLEQLRGRVPDSELDALITYAHKSTGNDSKLGIPNTTHLRSRLEQEISHANRHNHPFAFVMVDLDRFKHYNDAHGHPQGDRALNYFTDVVMRELRPEDTFGKYGGEEFYLILPETDAEAASSAVNRILEAIRVGEVPYSRKIDPDISNNPRKITASAGITVYPHLTRSSGSIGGTIEDILEHADEALYHAKHSGRDRYEIYNPSP